MTRNKGSLRTNISVASSPGGENSVGGNGSKSSNNQSRSQSVLNDLERCFCFPEMDDIEFLAEMLDENARGFRSLWKVGFHAFQNDCQLLYHKNSIFRYVVSPTFYRKLVSELMMIHVEVPVVALESTMRRETAARRCRCLCDRW